MKGPIFGGEGGIRTLGGVAPTPDFESGTFDHSATSPRNPEFYRTQWAFPVVSFAPRPNSTSCRVVIAYAWVRKNSLMKHAVVITTAFSLLTLLSGCASITQGTTQNLAFSIDTPGASCQVAREGDGLLGTVTFDSSAINVSKDKDDIVITCNAPGHLEKVVRLVSEADPISLIGGFILDGGIVDAITGAAWIYPLETKIALEQVQPSIEAAPEQEPTVEIALVEEQPSIEILLEVAQPSPEEIRAAEAVEPAAFLAELQDTTLPAEALITMASDIPGPQAPDFTTQPIEMTAQADPQRIDEKILEQAQQ